MSKYGLGVGGAHVDCRTYQRWRGFVILFITMTIQLFLQMFHF